MPTAATAIVAAVVLLPGCQEDVAQRPPWSIRVVTWNIHGCPGGIKPIVDELRGLDADVICLQEALFDTQDGRDINQAVSIAESLNMRCYSAGSALPGGSEQRMAILFRGRIEGPEALDADTGRIYGVTAVVHWRQRAIRIASVHLTSTYRVRPLHGIKTSRARYTEALDLSNRMREWSGAVIVAGDLNSVPGMPAYERVAAGLPGAAKPQPTFPSNNPSLAIDHVLHTHHLQTASRTVSQCRASDHLAVAAEIRDAAANSDE